jgi:hypothetical protein
MSTRTRTTATLTLTLTLTLATPAHAGAAAGGASEVTQLLNNAELIAQVGEAVQTTSNTLMTAQSTIQALRQLPDALLSEALGGLSIAKIQALADAYTSMSQSKSVYDDAENVLRQAVHDSEKLGIPPSELLRHKANLAYREGGVYKQTYEQEVGKISQLTQTSAEVQKQAEIVMATDSTVGGIQGLAAQNVAMQSTLAMISHSIATANKDAMIAAQREANERGDVAAAAAELDEVRRRNARTPDAKLGLPWDHGSQK